MPIRTRVAASHAAIVFALFLLGVSVAKGDAPPLAPGAFVGSKSLADDPNHSLDPYVVSVHVILQTHLTPILASRATQDMAALALCQDRVLATALELAGKGVRAVVVEGFYASGTLKDPRSLPGPAKPHDGTDAKWALLGRQELTVYGFAVRYLNDYSNAIANDLGRSSSFAKSITVGKETTIAQRAAADQLVQEEVTRVNVWRAGILPTISFLGLQSALAVALSRNERQVQLLIGKDHWEDLVYAINRQKDVRIRLVPYQCP